MTLPLELGHVTDDYARRALEQISLRWPAAPDRRTPVAVLPSNPADGQEIYYQTTAMQALGVVWHLRYRAYQADVVTLNPSSSKWEFVGGAPWFLHTTAVVSYTTGATTFTAGPALAAPQITVPVLGDYIVTGAVSAQSATATADFRVLLHVAGVANGTLGAGGATGTGMFTFSGGLGRALTLATGNVLDIRIAANTVSRPLDVHDRYLSLLPVRLGP